MAFIQCSVGFFYYDATYMLEKGGEVKNITRCVAPTKHEHNHHNIMFSFCFENSRRITFDILSFSFSFMVEIRVEIFVNKIKHSIAWKCFRVTTKNIQYKYLMNI